MIGNASGRLSAGIADRPSSARITIGFGNVQARLVLPRPLSPRMVTMAGRSSGFLIVDKTLMYIPHWVVARWTVPQGPRCPFSLSTVVNVHQTNYTCQQPIYNMELAL